MTRSHRLRYTVAGVFAVLVAGAAMAVASFGGVASSSPGGSVAVGPGATVVDKNTGFAFTFGLRADEDTGNAGSGSAVLGLEGPAVSLCTVHGPGASVDFTNVGDEAGNSPYPEIQCGRAFGQTVAVDGCVATFRAHGFMHSDYPLVEFLDGVTIEARFQKTGATTGNLDVTVPTAGGKVEVHGKVTGPIVMTTCP